MQLTLEGVVQSYGRNRVLRELSVTLAAGSIGCLLGPSGCGKTTALRCVAGFEPIEAGRILADDRVLTEPHMRVPPERRSMGMVFQDYALFPHLDVAGNVGFGLRSDAPDKDRRVEEMLSLVGLGGLGRLFPHQLSGGQQQRVALARALAPSPGLLLLDEPFSNLDATLKVRIGFELRDLLKQLGTTALLVTHDQREAFAMADQIGVMNMGRLEQWATAYDLYHRPASRFVADFIGEGAFVPGRVRADGSIHVELGTLPGETTRTLQPSSDVDVLLRPDDIVHDEESPLTARIERKAFRGAQILYTLALPSGHRVQSLVPSHCDRDVGSELGIRLATSHVVAWPIGGDS